MTDQQSFGNVYYDINERKFKMAKERNHVSFCGGGLIDEVGLGKTVQMTALSLLNPPSDVNYIKHNKLNSRATLVLCPNHLSGQWKRELNKMIVKSHNVKIVCILNKRHFANTTYNELMDADFVIVPFTFLKR